ncbi:hypothetical protein FOXYSP1_13037 [Fusarium oxysporum f. sp. phaseoli]
METTDVIIVGAGPSGLALALALSYYKVRSVILEKNRDICQDPRGIALAGDSHRIMELLGISSSKLSGFGQNGIPYFVSALNAIHFHRDSFNNKPFLSVDSYSDYHNQSLPGATLILQPRLANYSTEEELRSLLQSSEYAQLRTECAVTSCREGVDSMEVSFTTSDGTLTDLRGKYLVGADGTRGIVRKEFLEPRGVEQAEGKIHYAVKWVAANLRITIPTPTSHSYFPLWKLGYEPEEVWDVFWPEGVQFEYELTSETLWEEAEQDALKRLEARMEPHLTISAARFRYVWNCTVPKVRKETCTNRYQDIRELNRKDLFDSLGIALRYCDVPPHRDAAHVFPPFGAQGIANGIRDSFALSWRLALLCDENQHGAGQTAQIWVKMAGGTVLLSDHIFRESTSILTVLVLGSVTAQEASELKQVIDAGELPPNILVENVVILRGDESPYNSVTAPWISELLPCRPDDLEKMGVSLLRGYDPVSFRRRFHSSTRYVLVRPDFIVFSQAKSIKELVGQLGQAKKLLAQK